jgi:DNA-binding MarR family transcriptional regulator
MEYIDCKKLSSRFIDFFHTFNSSFFQKINFPIPANQWIALCVVNFCEPLTATTLANHLSISKQQVLQIVNKLSKDGYVSRQIFLNDRRCKNITLTEKGYQILMTEVNLLTCMFEEKTDILTNLELAEFDEAIKTIAPLFEKMYIANK